MQKVKQEEARKRINLVELGGGRGLARILFGSRLCARFFRKIFDLRVTGICNNVDDGGATKIAMEDYGGPSCLGDVTRGMAALAHTDWEGVLDYRLTGGRWDAVTPRHTILLGLLDKYNGDLDRAIREMCMLLQTGDHRMLTITSDRINLEVDCVRHGRINQNITDHFNSESKFDKLAQDEDWSTLRVKRMGLGKPGKIGTEAALAIRTADYIGLTPGSFHTNLKAMAAVEGFKEAIGESKAVIFLWLNIFRTNDPTYHWDAGRFVDESQALIGKPVNYIIGCSSDNAKEIFAKSGRERISYRELQREERDWTHPRAPRRFRKYPLAFEDKSGEFINKNGEVGHDPAVVAEVLRELIQEGEKKKALALATVVGVEA